MGLVIKIKATLLSFEVLPPNYTHRVRRGAMEPTQIAPIISEIKEALPDIEEQKLIDELDLGNNLL